MNRGKLQHKHVEVFRAVIQSGSMTGASRLLQLTQPGVSKIIAQTEEICGFTLFERLHGRLVPTQRALNLFDETELMFVGMEEISRLLDRLRAEEPRQALIASVPIFAQELLPQVVARWFEIDSTRLAISTRHGGGVLALVSSRRAEVGLVSSVSCSVPGIRSFTIARCRAMAAVPPGHALLEREVLRPADFHGQRFIASSRYEGIQTLIDRVFADERVKPIEVVECPLILGAAAMATAGVGLTFVDAFSAQSFRAKGLALRPFEPSIVFEYRAIWSEGLRSAFNRSAFLNLLREEAEEVLAQHERCKPAAARP